jgi:hypothetical protein
VPRSRGAVGAVRLPLLPAQALTLDSHGGTARYLAQNSGPMPYQPIETAVAQLQGSPITRQGLVLGFLGSVHLLSIALGFGWVSD